MEEGSGSIEASLEVPVSQSLTDIEDLGHQAEGCALDAAPVGTSQSVHSLDSGMLDATGELGQNMIAEGMYIHNTD